MKKAAIIILITLISTIVYSQKFETRLAVSPLMSFNSNQSTESRIAFGFATSVQEFYRLTEYLAIGSEIRYSFENYKMTKNFEGITIPEAAPYYESIMSVQALSVPFILQLQSKSEWSVNISYGLSYQLDYRASVDYVYDDWFSEDVIRTEIRERSVEPTSDLTTYISAGFGKGFKINDLMLTTKIYYTYSFGDYRLEHIGVNAAEILHFYDINPQYLGLEIAIGL